MKDNCSISKGLKKFSQSQLIIPIIAVIGSLLIIIGGLSNPMTLVYILMCAVVIVLSIIFLNSKNKA